jgi:hypothetical protein
MDVSFTSVAKGWRKASLPGSHPGPKWLVTVLVYLAMLPLQKPFKGVSTCASFGRQSVKRLSRSDMRPLNPLVKLYYILLRNMHTKTC